MVTHSVVSTPGARSRKSPFIRIALSLIVLFVAAAAAWALLGGRDSIFREQATAEIESTIRRYNELLTEGYQSLDMTGMREVASQLQAEDEYIHMSSLAEGGVRLDPELKQFELLTVSVGTTSATAETRELWDYRHYSRETGDLVLEQKGLEYHLAWDLSREPDGRWLVTDVRAISSTATVEPSAPGAVTPMMPEQ
jgi:hypothetical protein